MSSETEPGQAGLLECIRPSASEGPARLHLVGLLWPEDRVRGADAVAVALAVWAITVDRLTGLPDPDARPFPRRVPARPAVNKATTKGQSAPRLEDVFRSAGRYSPGSGLESEDHRIRGLGSPARECAVRQRGDPRQLILEVSSPWCRLFPTAGLP